MSMENKNNDEVNVIQEYKKIYDECEVADKVKILGNIQKYQIDMLKIKTMVQLQQIREQNANYIQTEINDKGEVVETTKKPQSKIKIEFTNYHSIIQSFNHSIIQSFYHSIILSFKQSSNQAIKQSSSATILLSLLPKPI